MSEEGGGARKGKQECNITHEELSARESLSHMKVSVPLAKLQHL